MSPNIIGIKKGLTRFGPRLSKTEYWLLRVIIPPLTSQYLNLTKNSSLAVAIAYPDLVSVFAGTTMMQTGRAVEILAMTMAVYLSLSLTISLFMNWYNKAVAIKDR